MTPKSKTAKEGKQARETVDLQNCLKPAPVFIEWDRNNCYLMSEGGLMVFLSTSHTSQRNAVSGASLKELRAKSHCSLPLPAPTASTWGGLGQPGACNKAPSGVAPNPWPQWKALK